MRYALRPTTVTVDGPSHPGTGHRKSLEGHPGEPDADMAFQSHAEPINSDDKRITPHMTTSERGQRLGGSHHTEHVRKIRRLTRSCQRNNLPITPLWRHDHSPYRNP